MEKIASNQARIFNVGNSKAISYTKNDEKYFPISDNDIVIKKYSDDHKSMTLVKVTPEEYKKSKLDYYYNKLKNDHGAAMKALENL
ncbi:hypothetical protein ACYATP_02670 [Lactobacillaceae bacterium Melli_B4]